MSETHATVSERRRISGIWLVPIVALVLGLWMVIHTIRSQGPEISIVFSTGEGIEADKTKIKLRAVEIGLVESVGLADDLESVVVTARLDKAAAPLLREGTQFWVVRPRVGPGGVSGLGTLLSGGYIQLSPGTGSKPQRHFEALEDPPVTAAGTPGLHLRLTGEQAGSVGSGDPILYRGFVVGRIESAEFDVKSQKMKYGAFIEAPYDELVNTSTRFWNASGLSLKAGADGIEVETASLETLLVGGVTFGVPDGVGPGSPVEDERLFQLFPSHAAVVERPYQAGLEYVVSFSQSLRGLKPGAPVEYRGIPVGEVKRVLLAEMASQGLRGENSPIAVLIRLEPGRLEMPDSEESNARFAAVIENAVSNGLRASLATGSLLTGSKLVYLDAYPSEPPAEMGSFAGFPTIPTVAGGLEGIEVRISALLDKVNDLPLDALLRRVDRLVADVDQVVASDAMQSLPASLESTLAGLRTTLDSVSSDSAMQERVLRTMGELDRTLQSLRQLLDTLDDQPNALIFNRDPGEDPRPPAGSQ